MATEPNPKEQIKPNQSQSRPVKRFDSDSLKAKPSYQNIAKRSHYHAEP